MISVIKHNTDSREQLINGVNALANAVKVTLGAKGRNVFINNPRGGQPMVTKDGVTVARSINLPNKFENMGVQVVKAAAEKTASNAGDGTTTSTILAQVIINEGMKKITSASNPIDIKKGIDAAVAVAVKEIAWCSQEVDIDSKQLVQIATISANNDAEIGKMVAKTINKVGKDGVITIFDSNTHETWVEFVEGLQIDKGYISPHFINNPKKSTVDFDDAVILLFDRKISTFTDLEDVLVYCINQKKPLLIIAEDVDQEALATLIANKVRNNTPLAAIKLPSFGGMQKGMLEDIAVLTGGTVISHDSGDTLKSVGKNIAKYLGRAKNISISASKCSITGGFGDQNKIKDHVSKLKDMVESTEEPFLKERIKTQRLAKVSNGVASIYVGGGSEIEMKERKDRIDDAVCATKSALREGVVPGGGVAFLHARGAVLNMQPFTNPDMQIGVNIIAESLLAPISQMAINAGIDIDYILKLIEESNHLSAGFNFVTNEVEPFFETGIIDPAFVSRECIENAASVSSMFLTTECAIVDWPEMLPEPK